MLFANPACAYFVGAIQRFGVTLIQADRAFTDLLQAVVIQLDFFVELIAEARDIQRTRSEARLAVSFAMPLLPAGRSVTLRQTCAARFRCRMQGTCPP